MTNYFEFGFWADALRGDVGVEEGRRAARHLGECPECRNDLAEARTLDRGLSAAAGGAQRPHGEHEDLLVLAVAVDRGAIPAEVWTCAECTELVVATLRGSPPAVVSEIGARRARNRTRWLVPVAAGALAAGLAGFAFRSEPAEGWARSAGLRRGQVWLLPAEISTAVESAVSSGVLAPPRFDAPVHVSEVEREQPASVVAPLLLFPRWEAVREPRPGFRWTPAPEGDTELILLDGEKKFLWSQAGGPSGIGFPATEAALVPGGTYFWKVNRGTDGTLTASPYAGFTVLSIDEARRCDARLDDARGLPFVEGIVAESCGMYTRAAAALEEAARHLREPELALKLAREVHRRQGLDPHPSGH